MLRKSRIACLILFLVGATTLHFISSANGDPSRDELAQDQKVILEVKERCEALKNLTYLCDEIGPRLTGSNNLKRANAWAAEKMKAYGLTNVHQEPWTMPEGWERGTASVRLLEPETGRTIHVASYGWTVGTPGKIQADVVVLKANTSKELAEYKGKLKGKVVLTRPPSRVSMTDDLATPGQPMAPREPGQLRPEGGDRAIMREVNELLSTEGVAAILSDSGKPYDLLNAGGGWSTRERTSATNRVPHLFVAHQDYAMLYRLGSRPEPAKTRLEMDIRNTFIPGPIVVNNTVGEIPGSDKPDEIVVVGAHLDSWDLGQGATDNGTGTVVILEAARALIKSGAKPKRTIRFILFTGEEQGLHGSAAYVAAHKDEMAKITAALVHDTGTGKVTGLTRVTVPLFNRSWPRNWCLSRNWA
jgi:carboxypeptidase Q